MLLSVTRIFNISYAHSLPGYDGKCAELHGHNAMIEVEFTVDDEVILKGSTAKSCMVYDFNDIKNDIGAIIDYLDHKDLNTIFEYPTAEVIVLFLVNRIKVLFSKSYGKDLSRVRFYETPNSFVEWRR